jgi:hypothetical protein
MSELSIFTFDIAINDLSEGAINFLGNQGIELNGPYLATQEREFAIKDTYFKNRFRLEEEHFSLTIEPEKPLLKHETENTPQLKAIHIIAMNESIAQIEPMATIAKKSHGHKLKKASKLIETMKRYLLDTNANADKLNILANKCEPLLREMATETHSLLSKTEDLLVSKTLTTTLEDLGYDVHMSGADLVGSKGSVSLRAKAEGGRLRMDTTAYSGLSCQSEIGRLRTELSRRGIILGRVVENASKTFDKKHKLTDPLPLFEKDFLNSGIAIEKASEKQRDVIKKANQDKSKVVNNLLLNRLHQTNSNLIERRLP